MAATRPRKTTPARSRQTAGIFEDPIPDAIKALQRAGRKNKQPVNWVDVEKDLRAVCLDYQFSDRRYPLGQPTAGIASSRRQVAQAQRAAVMAARLPSMLAALAISVFGPPGQSFVDRRDVELYVDQLGKLQAALAMYEALIGKAVRSLGPTRGRKWTLVDHLIGTPVQRLLFDLRRIWREATGGARFGEAFEGMAKSIMDAYLPRQNAETGDLERQIEGAKKLKAGRRNVFDALTEFAPVAKKGDKSPPR
jgi:hypothetical protein